MAEQSAFFRYVAMDYYFSTDYRFSTFAVAESCLPHFLYFAQPIIILIVNDISVKPLKQSLKSGEVETIYTRKGQTMLRTHTHAYTRMYARRKHIAQLAARYYFQEGRTAIVGMGGREICIYISEWAGRIVPEAHPVLWVSVSTWVTMF